MRRHDSTRRARRALPFIATACLAVLFSLAGAPDAPAAGLLIADGGFGGQLEIEEHAVEVTINNGIAVTHVNQVFRNKENRQVEALYTFPVPKGASVANFSMWINGKEVVGEVVEKQRARQIYDSYKEVRRDPGLLEQVDYKTFEMRIFPIAAGAEQRVQITYYQELDFDGDWATYVYPLATATRKPIESRTRGRFALDLRVLSEVPITSLESPSHGDGFVVAKRTPRAAHMSLEVTGGDLNRDVVLAYHLERPMTGLDLVASKVADEDGYFLMTLTAGDELGQGNDEGMDYVFVLDISGSMDRDGKLAISRNSVDSFIRGLGPKDRFEILTFNLEANSLFKELRLADRPTADEAVAFLRTQQARGGTFLEPAIRAAYAYQDADRPLNVVILSDGMTEQRERRTLPKLIAERPANARVFAIGVGNEVNRPLLEQLAEGAGGLAAFVSRGDDFERQAKAFRRKLLRPVGTNLELEVVGDAIYDIEPRRLPNLYHGAPIRIYGRYKTAGAIKLKLRGTLGGETFERELAVDLPGADDAAADNPELERMWAWHRVQRLLKQADRVGDREPVLAEIVRLGEGYSIVTEYTSFLVLENDAEYRRWKIERRNALRVARDRRAQERVRTRLAEIRRDTANIGPIDRTDDLAESKADAPTVGQPSTPSRNWDIQPRRRPNGGGNRSGGGALDPASVGIVVALGGIVWRVRRRRRRRLEVEGR